MECQLMPGSSFWFDSSRTRLRRRLLYRRLYRNLSVKPFPEFGAPLTNIIIGDESLGNVGPVA